MVSSLFSFSVSFTLKLKSGSTMRSGCCRVLQIPFQAEFNPLNLNYNLILWHAAPAGRKKLKFGNNGGALMCFPEKGFLNSGMICVRVRTEQVSDPSRT